MNLPIEILSETVPCAACDTLAHLRAAVGQTPDGQVYQLVCTKCSYSAPPAASLEAAAARWNAVQGVRAYQMVPTC